MEEHEQMCQQQLQVGCPYGNIGCQERLLFNDNINGHLMEQNELHARLLIECVGRLQNEIEVMRTNIATLTVERLEQQNEMETMKNDITRLTEERREQQIEIEAMRTDITRLTEERREQQNEMEAMKNDITRLIEESLEHQKIAEQQAEQIMNCDREMRAVKDENQSMKQQIISLQSEIETNRPQREWPASPDLAIKQQLSEQERSQYQMQAAEMREQAHETWLKKEAKFEVLEQHLANEKEQQQRSIDEERRENQARCDDMMMRVQNNWINVENRQRGAFLWCIDQWDARRLAVRNGTSKERIFSDTFWLYKEGYRMCLSVWLGDNDLCVVWHLMRSVFDEHLTWPFRGYVTVSVVDQLTRLDHASYTLSYSHYMSDRRLKRPKTERNYGIFPKEKFIGLEELSRNPALCRNDRVLIRCVVTMAI